MKTMSNKQDSKILVQEFLAKGGKIVKCPPAKPKPRKTNEITVIEIEVEALPPELHKYLAD